MELLHRNPSHSQIFSSEVFQKIIPHFTEDLGALKSKFYSQIKEKHPNICSLDLDKQRAVIRDVFGSTVGQSINQTGITIDAFTIRVIHAFFDNAIPEVGGICLKCFQVSMPNTGFGIRCKKQVHRGLYYEVRLSSEKLCGYSQQSEIYITNTFNIEGKIR